MANELFYRNFELPDEDVRKITVENRAIGLSFSSELPVQRWYGIEILSHNDGAIVKGRAKAVLFNHNADRIVGKFSGETYDGGKGRGLANFDETEEGDLAMKRVQSGSLRGVSVGYSVEKFRKLQPGEEYKLAGGTVKGRDDTPIYIAEKWSPREISLTPIPADHSVGIGRDATRSLDGIEIEELPPATAAHQEQSPQGGTKDMDEKEVTTRIDDAVRAAVETGKTTMKKVFDRAAAAGQEALAFRLFAEGKTEDDITDAIIAAQAKERGKPSGASEGADDGGKATRKLDEIDDATFIRSKTEPTLMVLD